MNLAVRLGTTAEEVEFWGLGRGESSGIVFSSLLICIRTSPK